MKNITVSVDDEIYHRARIRAALLNTSVSALVRSLLIEIAGEETEFERLRVQEHEIRARLKSQPTVFRAEDRMPREKVHERRAVR